VFRSGNITLLRFGPDYNHTPSLVVPNHIFNTWMHASTMETKPWVSATGVLQRHRSNQYTTVQITVREISDIEILPSADHAAYRLGRRRLKKTILRPKSQGKVQLSAQTQAPDWLPSFPQGGQSKKPPPSFRDVLDVKPPATTKQSSRGLPDWMDLGTISTKPAEPRLSTARATPPPPQQAPPANSSIGPSSGPSRASHFRSVASRLRGSYSALALVLLILPALLFSAALMSLHHHREGVGSVAQQHSGGLVVQQDVSVPKRSSNHDVCDAALDERRSNWSTVEGRQSYVTKATARKLRIEDCRRELGLPISSDMAPTEHKDRTLVSEPQAKVCELALNSARSEWGLDASSADWVAEAQRRGLTVALCKAALALWPTSGDKRPPARHSAVAVSAVNIRSAPSSTGAVIGILPKGASVEVLETENGWLHVAGSDGVATGWVDSSFLK
jgi:Bacterial SH3 domain